MTSSLTNHSLVYPIQSKSYCGRLCDISSFVQRINIISYRDETSLHFTYIIKYQWIIEKKLLPTLQFLPSALQKFSVSHWVGLIFSTFVNSSSENSLCFLFSAKQVLCARCVGSHWLSHRHINIKLKSFLFSVMIHWLYLQLFLCLTLLFIVYVHRK